MKKMMLVAVAVCAAAVAQAVGVAWGITVDKAYAGASAYIINTSTKSVSDVVSMITKDGVTDLSSIKWSNAETKAPTANNNGLVNQTAKNSGIEMSEGTQTAFVALLFKDSEGNWKYAVTDTMEKTYAGVGTPTFQFGNQSGLTWSAASGGGGGDDPIIPDVPEPTSMALVALGAAAFGLRRKLRK